MLNYIKEKIHDKKEFLEAASIIFEDTVEDLDDQIVLGDEEIDNTSDTYETDTSEDISDKTMQDPSNTDNTEDTSELPPEDPSPENEEENDVIDTTDSLSGTDGLPDIIGRQTGEPALPSDDLLDTEIDLSNNTFKDILPVPPSNAGESIGSDDILSQRVDSGFDESTETDALEKFWEKYISEAISLNGDGSDASADTSTNTDNTDNTEDTSELPPEDPSPENEEENDVTAAVKDKVSEMDSEFDTDAAASPSNKELFRKLSNITKTVEDVKKLVIGD